MSLSPQGGGLRQEAQKSEASMVYTVPQSVLRGSLLMIPPGESATQGRQAAEPGPSKSTAVFVGTASLPGFSPRLEGEPGAPISAWGREAREAA